MNLGFRCINNSPKYPLVWTICHIHLFKGARRVLGLRARGSDPGQVLSGSFPKLLFPKLGKLI